jgi:hypothetical protein
VVDTPFLGVPNLRIVAALERLVDAAGKATHIAFDLVPIGEDAVGTANGDGVVFLRLTLLLLPIGSLALGLSVCRFPRLLHHLEPLGLGSIGQRTSGRQHLSRLFHEFVPLTRMGSSNQVAVVEGDQTRGGFSFRRLASSGDTLASLPVLRHQEELELRQCLPNLVVRGDEGVDSLHLA